MGSGGPESSGSARAGRTPGGAAGGGGGGWRARTWKTPPPDLERRLRLGEPRREAPLPLHPCLQRARGLGGSVPGAKPPCVDFFCNSLRNFCLSTVYTHGYCTKKDPPPNHFYGMCPQARPLHVQRQRDEEEQVCMRKEDGGCCQQRGHKVDVTITAHQPLILKKVIKINMFFLLYNYYCIRRYGRSPKTIKINMTKSNNLLTWRNLEQFIKKKKSL